MTLLSNAVAIANKITAGLKMQTTVNWEQAVVDGEGGKTFPNGPQPLQAIVDWRQRNVVTKGGTLATCRATVTFLDPAIVIAFDDRITLPDNTTGPILTKAGPFDDSGTTTGQPLLTEVTIG